MIKLRAMVLGAALVLAMSAGVQAAMVFHLDFNQDGNYEQNHRMMPGDEALVDIYVSGIPAPGLGAMGFRLIFDSGKLEILLGGTQVDATNWPSGADVSLVQPGELSLIGFRPLPGLPGDDIILAHIHLRCLQSGGSVLMIHDRDAATDDFVLMNDPPTVLDSDIGDGLIVGRIAAPVTSGMLLLLLGSD